MQTYDQTYGEVPTERLEHEVTTLAAQLAAATCRFLLLVAELDRREAWKAWGTRSCADWLSWRCGVALGTARDQVRVARALRSLPEMAAAFERGELSYSKVRALVRVATADSEAELVELARTTTAAHLDRIVSAALAAAAPASQQAAARRVLFSEEEGFGHVRARLSPDQHLVVRTAVEAAVAAQPADVSAETLEQRRADALVAICEAYLANQQPGARPAPERQQVVVHVDAAVVAGERAAEVEGTALVLHPDTARRLGCDATVLAMFERDGQTIGAGRTTRTIPRRLRRALHRRSGGRCQWLGCDERRHVEAHHLWHWTDGGPTELWNLANLCWWHHHAVHEGGFRLTFDGRSLAVHRPQTGDEIVGVPPLHADEPLGDQVEADAVVARWAGEQLDLACAVDGVLTRMRPGRRCA